MELLSSSTLRRLFRLSKLLLTICVSLRNPSSYSDDHTANGVFHTAPQQTLVLLLDFKTDGRDLYSHVITQLEPLRRGNFLSYWSNGEFVPRAITVVATGNVPYDLITGNLDRRDLFCDAPLHELWEPTNPLNGSLWSSRMRFSSAIGQGTDDLGVGSVKGTQSTHRWDKSTSYFASTSFQASIGFPQFGRLSAAQLEKIRGQIRGAKRRGLKVRYWDTPYWPVSLRNHIWQTLWEEGADILNVDDLYAAAFSHWDKVLHSWFNG